MRWLIKIIIAGGDGVLEDDYQMAWFPVTTYWHSQDSEGCLLAI
ncbi:hypothetical protein [Nitrosomonas communis]|nr:hypothetical protein [Nitrosomonas communis]